MSNDRPYFSYYNPKFQLQIHYTMEVMTENVLLSAIPILIFLCISITASSDILMFVSGEQVRNNLEVKLNKMSLRGQGQSVQSEKKRKTKTKQQQPTKQRKKNPAVKMGTYRCKYAYVSL